MEQMNTSTKQKQTHIHIVVAREEEGMERDGLGVWGWWMQTITFRMDKKQGPNV